MEKLTADFFSQEGSIPLRDGETVKKAMGNCEYYDQKNKESISCFIVFTTQRLLAFIPVPGKKKLFQKQSEVPMLAGEAPYDQIAALSRLKIAGDNSFCDIQLKDGSSVGVNFLGEVFGAITKQIETCSGMEFKKNSLTNI